MPIFIKGSGGGGETSFGYTEQYTEEDTEYFTLSSEDSELSIKPRAAAESYGLSRIMGVDNLCIRIRASAEFSRDMLFVWGATDTLSGRYLCASWNGSGSPSSGSDLSVRRNPFKATYDKATGVLTISANALDEFNNSEFSMDATVTWKIN